MKLFTKLSDAMLSRFAPKVGARAGCPYEEHVLCTTLYCAEGSLVRYWRGGDCVLHRQFIECACTGVIVGP
ncbi:hypothetical protein Afil01_54750 [Actinorhabdospora filicis]|uniref:Uncharacterized protein n=1 Tax=Actinorhabdospora filicis TaxID=1785913 RepID=A0A9W6SRC2_9ACTN|nr:hypothetical protein [Actinorhabdospora filicis]GLZ80668.1 hypothetical protein Afil01_54750 [Actinorhabdospora filicis]